MTTKFKMESERIWNQMVLKFKQECDCWKDITFAIEPSSEIPDQIFNILYISSEIGFYSCHIQKIMDVFNAFDMTYEFSEDKSSRSFILVFENDGRIRVSMTSRRK